jgi:hypothetical protein
MFIIPNAQVLYMIWPGTLGEAAGLWISFRTTEIREPGFRRIAVRRTGPGELGEKSWKGEPMGSGCAGFGDGRVSKR